MRGGGGGGGGSSPHGLPEPQLAIPNRGEKPACRHIAPEGTIRRKSGTGNRKPIWARGGGDACVSRGRAEENTFIRITKAD